MEKEKRICRKNNQGKPMSEERNKQILEMRSKGLTLDKIGKEVGVSKERVRQIIKFLSKESK